MALQPSPNKRKENSKNLKVYSKAKKFNMYNSKRNLVIGSYINHYQLWLSDFN